LCSMEEYLNFLILAGIYFSIDGWGQKERETFPALMRKWEQRPHLNHFTDVLPGCVPHRSEGCCCGRRGAAGL
jgi:hypothetical protein